MSDKAQAGPTAPGSMRFDWENETYVLEFAREKKKVTVVDPYQPDVKHIIESTHPYTTARIVRLDPDTGRRMPAAFLTATVGAWHKEKKVSNETGRLHALRTLSKYIDQFLGVWKRVGVETKLTFDPDASKRAKALKRGLWDAYMNRTARPAKAPAVVEGEVINEAGEVA